MHNSGYFGGKPFPPFWKRRNPPRGKKDERNFIKKHVLSIMDSPIIEPTKEYDEIH